MAVYKLIQDVEAEDKLLGPLTLKGFIYILIAGLLAFINIKMLLAPDLGNVKWALIAILLPPMILFTVLALPLGGEQPTEVWLLSRIRFALKSRQRIWDQSSLNDLVTITVPPKLDRQLTKTYSQTEVKSHLKTLALTLDSRGWAVKNVNLNAPAPTSYLPPDGQDPERLVGEGAVPQAVPAVDVHASDDILDEENNPKAQKVQGMMLKKDEQKKVEIQRKIEAARSEIVFSALEAQKGIKPAPPKDPSQIRISHQDALKTGQAAKKTAPAKSPPPDPVTSVKQAAKLELAQSGNDLSVASIAKLANRQPKVQQLSPSEVLISLH